MNNFNIRLNNEDIQFPPEIAKKLNLSSCQIIQTDTVEAMVIHLQNAKLLQNMDYHFGQPFSNLDSSLYCYYHNSFDLCFVKAKIGVRIWLQKEIFISSQVKESYFNSTELSLNILTS